LLVVPQQTHSLDDFPRFRQLYQVFQVPLQESGHSVPASMDDIRFSQFLQTTQEDLCPWVYVVIKKQLNKKKDLAGRQARDPSTL
jgi:hypothetical protein